MSLTAQQVAQLYAGGGSLTDAQIAELHATDHEAWGAAVCEATRECYLPKQKQPSKGAILGKQMLDATIKFFERNTAPIVERVKEQDRRIADLEARIGALEQRR